jgi:predicted site-specific integrase-resolvase
MLVKASVVKRQLQVDTRTLRGWHSKGYIKAVRVGGVGNFLYDISSLKLEGETNQSPQPEKIGIIYCRVSTDKQKKHLATQASELQEKYPSHVLIKDVGSGLNFKRKGLKKVLELSMAGRVQEVCIAHKDRLCRFAYDLIEYILNKHGVKIIVDAQIAVPSLQQDLCDDLLSIVTVFGARVYGSRSGSSRRKQSRQFPIKEAEDAIGCCDNNTSIRGSGSGEEGQEEGTHSWEAEEL